VFEDQATGYRQGPQIGLQLDRIAVDAMRVREAGIVVSAHLAKFHAKVVANDVLVLP
jgi:hypothetical protein